MVAILFLADGPKSIAFVFPVVLYHISNLKSIGEAFPKISRSQFGRMARQTDGGPTDARTGRKDKGNLVKRGIKMTPIYNPHGQSETHENML